MPTVVGIDPSLTCTGLVVLTDDRRPFHTSFKSTGKKDDTLYQRKMRLRRLAAEIVNFTMGMEPDLVVIEAPSMGSKFGHPHDRSGLWWLLVAELAVPIMEVSPAVRMKYGTGRGRADKDDVLTAVVRRYPEIEVQGNDQADALILAAIGRRLMGHPIEDSLPQTHLDALKKLVLP